MQGFNFVGSHLSSIQIHALVLPSLPSSLVAENEFLAVFLTMLEEKRYRLLQAGSFLQKEDGFLPVYWLTRSGSILIKANTFIH